MSFFLFLKPIVDIFYQYKFLDYLMVGLVFFLLLYQIALVRPEVKEWYRKSDVIVLILCGLTTMALAKNIKEYEIYFKVLSAFLMYFVGRLYYERIQECYGILVSSSYIIVYVNFFVRLNHYGLKFLDVTNANGDLYFYDTDMAYAMIQALIFISMFGKNSLCKIITILLVCPYMVRYSDAGIQKVLIVIVYGIILLYITELIFRKRKISNIILVVAIISLCLSIVIIYHPIFFEGNTESLLRYLDGNVLNLSNMEFRYSTWKSVIEEFNNHNISSRLFGLGFNTRIPVQSLYIKTIYSLGILGLSMMLFFIGNMIYYIAKVEDRKTFYLLIMMTILVLGTGVTVTSMEHVQMSWFPMLFAGMVVSSIETKEEANVI